MASSSSDGLEPADNYSRFLVLGGGVSGLSAAAHLARQGCRDFKLLEARARLGGRVLTMQMGGGPAGGAPIQAELGASWIHGVLGNPLYELASSHGLVPTVPAAKVHNVAAVTEDGRRLPFNILQETYEAYFWFFKRCEEYFLRKYQPPAGVKSVGQHVELEVNIYLHRFPLPQQQARRLVFDYLLKRECCITGCDTMNDIDLISIGSYTELPGGNITLPHGYSSLLAPLVQSIPEANVLKSKPVKHIHWKYRVEMEQAERGGGDDSGDSDSSVRTVRSAESKIDADAAAGAIDDASSSCASSVMSSRAASVCNTPRHKRTQPNVMVECEDGTRFYADHVICTVPLGVLKAPDQQQLFVPPLPQDKRQALDKLNFGTVNKIFLEYERPFLSPDISEVVLLWEPVPPTELSRLPMKDKWFRKIYSFSKLSETVLVAWVAGDEAKFMETLKLNVVAETCTAIMKKFLADPYVPKPKSCVFTAWHSQTYSRGSYSSIGLGGQQSHVEKVSEPLYQRPGNRTPVVSFAGEHCHPSFYSTAHGAFLTGRSAAQFFLSRANRNQDDEEVYNLGAASVADLSSWLQEVSLGEKSLEDYRSGKTRPSRDAGQYVTPR